MGGYAPRLPEAVSASLRSAFQLAPVQRDGEHFEVPG